MFLHNRLSIDGSLEEKFKQLKAILLCVKKYPACSNLSIHVQHLILYLPHKNSNPQNFYFLIYIIKSQHI